MIKWLKDLFTIHSPPLKGVLDSNNPPRISGYQPKPIRPACVACILRHEQEKRKENHDGLL